MLCELIVPHYAECFSACMSRRGKEQHITLFETGPLLELLRIGILLQSLERH